MSHKVETLPFWKKIMYSLGQLGWSLTSYSVGNLLVYFYLPPEKGGIPEFPPMVYQGYILGILTIIGIVFATGRLFDAVTDPLIAGLSDRSKSDFGRRRKFLAISIVPFALLSFLVFFPPFQGQSPLNSVWLFFTVIIFYWFMTMYVTPFFAWMSELGHNPDERLTLSTMISVTWALGFAIGSQVYLFKGIFQGIFDPATAAKIADATTAMAGLAPGTEAFIAAKGVLDSIHFSHDVTTLALQSTVGAFALVGFLFMLLPIIFIDENRYCEKHASNEGIFQSVLSAFKNKNFLYFTISDLAYWVALTCIATGMVFYVTVLLGLPEEATSALQIMMFGLSFLFYVPVTMIARKSGKKPLLLFAFVLFSVVYGYAFLLGKLPFEPMTQGYILVLLAAIPLAIFGILPNAIIADVAEADGIKTGNFKAAIFFGARTFMSKVGQMVAGFIFPSLLLLGKSPENDIGIRFTTIAALGFCLMGLVVFLKYNEKEVLTTLAEKEDVKI